MEIELDLTKSLEENATAYFEEAKKARKKIEGIKIAQEKFAKQKNTKEIEKKQLQKTIERKKKWFEKFHWFISSDSFLVVGGKSAKQNEEIVKNYMKKEDVYFHAEVFGAPHCIIKTRDEKTNKIKTVPETTMVETAQFAATFSKAFESGQSIADAYSVKPEQVSKKAPTGTSVGAGAFMIYGERNWFRKTTIGCAIGYYQKEKILMCGPTSAIKKKCIHIFELRQGGIEKNLAATKLQSKFKEKGFDFKNEEILSLLPNGKFEIL